ncbi:MAG: adenylate/guanylate cyclase domain-containing protein [Chitinophagaceae bacterium]
MKAIHKIMNHLSFIALYRLRWIALISVSWTVTGLLLYYRAFVLGAGHDFPYSENTVAAYLLRAVILFCFSAFMAYLLLTELRFRFRNYALLSGWALKTLLLLLVACLAIAAVFIAHFVIIRDYSFAGAFTELRYYLTHTVFFPDSLVSWLVIILVTQVVAEVDRKYSPGVLWGILTGKYMRPRTEKRIIMFLDLKDSTPIAEQLGHVRYFSFIKDFIYYVSSAILENDGHIYQYVGDEVVVTWKYRKRNILKAVNTVILARSILQRVSDYFRRRYGMAPEFRVGLHIGEVTMGEIGVMKKDIAISGEAMNITARIRTACGELNQKFVVSQAFFESNVLKSWQGENLGEIDLKGVEEPVKLYALKI